MIIMTTWCIFLNFRNKFDINFENVYILKIRMVIENYFWKLICNIKRNFIVEFNKKICGSKNQKIF